VEIKELEMTYSGMIMPNAAPRSNPVPRVDNRCTWSPASTS